MTEEWSDDLLRILAESTAETREHLLIDALTKRDAQAREWEQKARFWQHFYHESLRLFGDKRGSLKQLVAKAMTLLIDDCLDEATTTEEEKRQDRLKQERASGFNHHKFFEYCDRRRVAEWPKSYPVAKVVSSYIHMTYSDPSETEDAREARRRFEEAVGIDWGPLDKDEAIRRITRAFKFPSYEAAYQFLKREGVKGLPSTWPK